MVVQNCKVNQQMKINLHFVWKSQLKSLENHYSEVILEIEKISWIVENKIFELKKFSRLDKKHQG